jgi:hypothetical protein
MAWQLMTIKMRGPRAFTGMVSRVRVIGGAMIAVRVGRTLRLRHP